MKIDSWGKTMDVAYYKRLKKNYMMVLHREIKMIDPESDEEKRYIEYLVRKYLLG